VTGKNKNKAEHGVAVSETMDNEGAWILTESAEILSVQWISRGAVI
jgi:hypothetical protein